MITLTSLSKIYRTNEIETVALENVNLKVDRGEFLSIMGPSGCGKSTFSRTSCASLRRSEEAIWRYNKGSSTLSITLSEFIRWKDWNTKPSVLLRKAASSLSFIPSVCVPFISIVPAVGASSKPIMFSKVDLSHRMRHFPTQLSGGQCQRVAIASAIIGNPEIILADEPTGNLDSKMGAEVMELLHRLNKEDGRTIVMVTHNEEQAGQTSRTVRFFDGRQVQ